MKHNPRLNEKMARLPGFADIHPLQPRPTVQGALELMDRAGPLAEDADRHAGRRAVAQGRRPRRALRPAGHPRRARGQGRRPQDACWSPPPPTAPTRPPPPSSATRSRRSPRPPTAASTSPTWRPSSARDVAAIMVTNPNTCGLFERDIIEIARLTHAAGAYFYCDGANFNAIVGRVRPGDLGVDAMHINLHKTFSTPHGGGGPGAGPVVLSAALAPFAPAPWVVHGAGRLRAWSSTPPDEAAQAFGRICAFHGQMGMYVRALHLHAEPRRRRPAPGRRGRGAQRQLHQGPARRRHDRRPSRTAPACTRRCSTTPGWRAPASPRSTSPRR